MKRSEVKAEHLWRLEDIFETDAAWEKAFAETAQQAGVCVKYRGKLTEKGEILKCFKENDILSQSVEKLYAYARMRHDEDAKNGLYKEMSDRIQSLYVLISGNNAFMMPELSALSDKVLETLAGDPDFKAYDYFLRRLITQKKYILSEKEEKLLAEGGEVFGAFSEIFSMLDNADLTFPAVKGTTGKKVQLSHAKYSVCLQSADAKLRRSAFKGYYASYTGLINTIAEVYSASVKKDWYVAKARGYQSCMARALESEDVPEAIYNQLLSSVGSSLKTLHEYVALRKKVLGVRTLHMYDLYVPICENAGMSLEYEQACALVSDGLKPLGWEYGQLIARAMNERWIDVFETDNKRSGAYSFGVHGVHPFVLLNYEKTTHDVFTIAHELGHAMHSYYSSRFQPYGKADYTIFVAEVASTVNEVLLLKHVINTTDNEVLKKYLLSYYLDMFRTTLFRQTMFSEFEAEVHGMTERDEPLSVKNMSELYLKLNKKYYGKAVMSDTEIQYEWARIPHFYRSFYVYKYATGLTCAVAIARRVLTEGEKAVKDYRAFLSSGGSAAPADLLKIAGVDLTVPAPYEAAMREFSDTLEELKKLCNTK